MDLYRFDPLATSVKQTVSRRAAVGRLGGGGLAAALLATVGLQRRAAAQDATPAAPAGWRTEHLEVEFTPGTPLPGSASPSPAAGRRSGATGSISTRRSTRPATPAAPRSAPTSASGPGPTPPTTPPRRTCA